MRVAVIGSGPSGLHFAATALELGHSVVLLDGGHTGGAQPLPDENLVSLKSKLSDSVRYFLGEDYQSIEVGGGASDESGVYGFPGAKSHVFTAAADLDIGCNGFSPLLSLAAGGLAECWTAGAYPYTDSDLVDFPFAAADIAPHYGEVAGRIGIGGEADDMAGVFPIHENLDTPIELNTSSDRLLRRYRSARNKIRRADPGAVFGRSRQAALSAPLGPRDGCKRCGRCLWGCPVGALYTPSLTLEELRQNSRLEYHPGALVSHLSLNGQDQIEAINASTSTGTTRIKADVYVLAAGTLQSSKILLRSYWARDKQAPVLTGLMDNRQVLLPFLNLAMLGHPYSPDSYQYHQLALGFEDKTDAFNYVHGQITALTTATAHPIMKQLPINMRSARSVFTTLRSALGLVNLNFADVRRPENTVALDPENPAASGLPGISISYTPPKGEAEKLDAAIRRAKRLMRALRAPVIPGMVQVRPMGSSVHYTGTIPMSVAKKPQTVSAGGRSHDIDNLLVADGSVFPALPAKNLTFTLMANACRIARVNL